MTLVETEEVATRPPRERLSKLVGSSPVRVQGKFFFVGGQVSVFPLFFRVLPVFKGLA